MKLDFLVLLFPYSQSERYNFRFSYVLEIY